MNAKKITSIRLNDETLLRLSVLQNLTKRSRSQLVELAVNEYLQQHKTKTTNDQKQRHLH